MSTTSSIPLASRTEVFADEPLDTRIEDPIAGIDLVFQRGNHAGVVGLVPTAQ